MTEERAVTLYRAGGLTETIKLAEMFVKSGYFQDVRDVAQAMVKIQYGAEMGFDPMASLMGVHIIKGKPTLGSNLMGAAVKRSSKYDYRIKTATDDVCELEWFEADYSRREMVSVGTSKFTIKEAEHAGLAGKDNWRAYASDMLFARALSRGVRRYCPDVTGGIVAYTPEDMAAIPTTEQVSPVVSVEKPANGANDVPMVTDGETNANYRERWMRQVRGATTIEQLKAIAKNLETAVGLTDVDIAAIKRAGNERAQIIKAVPVEQTDDVPPSDAE